MANIFEAPGYFDREVDLSVREQLPTGIPAVIIGAAQRGPAFFPVTVGGMEDYNAKFGTLSPKKVGGYAAKEFLQSRTAAAFIRVLGAGANAVSSDFDTTRTQGTVKNAGMVVSGTATGVGRHMGFPQFLVASHILSDNEAFGFPQFSDNDSISTAGEANLVRAELFTTVDARFMIMSSSDTFDASLDDLTDIETDDTSPMYRKFKLVLSTSAGAAFANDDGFAGIKIYTASLDPSSDSYVGKILNTNPERFSVEKHLLYGDFAVDSSLAMVKSGSIEAVAILSGSTLTSATSGDATMTMLEAFGRFDTRYTTPKTPVIISQPFGNREYDLFHFESLDDGQSAGTSYKVSISSLKASSSPNNQYGTFSVLVRAFDDTDMDAQIVEQHTNVSLDPNAENYIAKVIGDKKTTYLFDAEAEEDRKIKVTGKYPLRSKFIRVVMNEAVEKKTVPARALPFGFRGIEVLNTNYLMTDAGPGTALTRLAGSGSIPGTLSGSIVPPVPFRFKVTRGETTTAGAFTGAPGNLETTDSRLFWGVKFEKNESALNPNVSSRPNPAIASFAMFPGIKKLDVLVSGSSVDTFNNNKFTLAKVALSAGTISGLTASVNQHMREAAYIRNGVLDTSTYTITDGAYGKRVTLASLLSSGSATDFNRFADFAKFTTFFVGGWDGVNIFDKNCNNFNDLATSTETGGGASSGYVSPGASSNLAGQGLENNCVASYRTAINIATDEVSSLGNLFVIPGQREPLVTDYAAQKNQDNGLMFYIMDIPAYDSDGVRIFDGDTSSYLSTEMVATTFDARLLDFDAAGAYYPNYVADDETNRLRVTLPASIAALGAFGYNDKVAYPWYAPAGVNRGSLNVKQTKTKVSAKDRNRFETVRINPIVKVTEANNSFHALLSQRSLKLDSSSFLTTINVKRMVLELKRQLKGIGNSLIWETGIVPLRAELKKQATTVMSTMQTRLGIERYEVICDSTNNTDVDVDQNKINAKIKFIPVRATEFIEMDFITTPTGMTFA